MRNVSIQELAEDTEACIAEVEAGHKLVLMRGNKAVAEITPAPEVDQMPQLWKTEEERRANAVELLAILDSGYDLGGFKIENRDELYERD
jgi:antitoxin (DNA-binding transcriptional repressor) of toxin-antitoxin stability system